MLTHNHIIDGFADLFKPYLGFLVDSSCSFSHSCSEKRSNFIVMSGFLDKDLVGI
jgi:hypothetical protein